MHPNPPLPVRTQRAALTPAAAATAVSLAAVIAVTLAGVTIPEVLTAAGPVALAVGFLLGLPHGAADHLVPRWAAAGALRRAGMVTVVAGYVTAAGLAWAALSFVGPWALPVMMLVSIVHFGLGDVVTEVRRESAPAPTGVGAGRRRVRQGRAVHGASPRVLAKHPRRRPERVRPAGDRVARTTGPFDAVVPAGVVMPGHRRAGLAAGAAPCRRRDRRAVGPVRYHAATGRVRGLLRRLALAAAPGPDGGG